VKTLDIAANYSPALVHKGNASASTSTTPKRAFPNCSNFYKQEKAWR
jgi:hypothetical protein